MMTRWKLTSPPPRRQRILLVRNDRVGDLALTLPAFEAARRHWPHAHLTALVSRYAGSLVAGYPALNDVLVDNPSDGAWQLGTKLRRWRFDTALIFNTNTRNCQGVWLAGVRRRVCWAGKPWGWLSATDRVTLRRGNPPVHEAEFALAFVRQLGATSTLSELNIRLPIRSQARERVSQRIARQLGSAGPLFGVHPGSRQSAYNWSPQRYAQLVAQLAARGRVMVTGSPEERPILEQIAGTLEAEQKKRVGFFTDLSLSELVAGIAEQSVLVVSSTGPMHLAGIVGTPTVALFSPHPAHVPAKWAPLGTNHTLLVAPLANGEDASVPRERGEALMARIGVAEVLAAALRYTPGALAGAA